MNKLTAKSVEKLKKQGYYSDGNNLYLQVSKSLNKSWLFIYKKNGKKTEIGLGSFKFVTLAEARSKATEYKKMIHSGLDPYQEKKRTEKERLLEQAKSASFKQCCLQYISLHQHSWKNVKHEQQWRNTLEQYCYPIIGELPISEIDTGLVTKCLEPIWITKNETASRLRGRIETVLDWAKIKGFRNGENPARWRGHLDKVLPKPSKVQKPKHFSALPYNEIKEFMQELKQVKGIGAKCLEFTILTACRTNESIGAKWVEFDFDSKIWIIPANRMKAEKEHRVPLTDYTIQLLDTIPKINDFVFPGKGKNGLSNMAMAQVLKRMNRNDITVHGFRSCFRDWAAECTQFHNDILEMCLAHTIKNASEAAYRRGDMIEKRRIVMEQWQKHILSI